MPTRAEDAAGIPLRPVALSIGLVFASGVLSTATAQSFDPSSPVILHAYSAPLDTAKVEAARTGLNLLLPQLRAFPELLPRVPVGGFGSVDVSGSFVSISHGWWGSAFPTSYSTWLTVATDAELIPLGNPVTLSDTILEVVGSFSTARDFILGPDPVMIDTRDTLLYPSGTELTVTGTVTANATLTKAGLGTLVLTGNNVWLAAPVVESGTLKGTVASLQTPLTNDGVVEFAQTTDAVYGFRMEGTGSLRKSGGGTLTLSAPNAYAGATWIEEGRLALLGAGTVGAGAVSIAAGSTFDLSNVGGDRAIGSLSGNGGLVLGGHRLDTVSSADSTFGGVISGPGVFGKGGTGRLTLTGASTYSGPTIVTEGTLALTGAGRLNSASALRMNASAVFDISDADGGRSVGSITGDGRIVLGANSLTAGSDNTDTVFGGTLAGSGVFTKTGTGTLTLTGVSEHTGATMIERGTLLVRAQSLGPLVTNNASLVFIETRTASPGEPPVPAGTLHASYPELYVYSGNISGTGEVIKRGSGALWLRGENSYRGGTRIEDGLLIGNDRSLQGTIVNDSGLAFYQAADGIYSGNTSGSGILLKYGPGNLTLAGINTHSGGTAFSGPLTVTDDRSLGAPGGAVVILGGTLRTTADIATSRPFGIGTGGATFDTGAHTLELSSTISGPGALNKIGTGALLLTGSNTYTGTTNILAGTLSLGGTLASPLRVAAGAKLAGSGTVNGDVTLAPGSTLAVRVDASGSTSRISAASAHVEGARLDVEAQAGQYQARTDYAILTTANGVTGRFAQVTSNLPFLQPQLEYGTHSVGLTLVRNDAPYQSVAQTPAQSDIATALGAVVSSGDPDAGLVGATLDGLSAPEARAAFDSIGGVGRAQAVVVQQYGLRAVTQQAMARLSVAEPGGAGAGNPIALGGVKLAFHEAIASDAQAIYAAATSQIGMEAHADSSRHGFWLRGFSGSGRFDGQMGASDARFRFAGIVAGYDRSFGDRLRIGAYWAYSRPKLTQDNPEMRSEADNYQLGAYGRYRDGRLRIDAVAGVSRSDFDARRVVNAGGLARTASSDYDARTASAYIEAGYAFGHSVLVEPVVGLEWSRQRNDAYTETGAGAFNLAEPGRSIVSLKSSFGMRVQRTWEQAGARTTVEGRAVWAHEFRSQSAISARFAADPTEAAFAIPTLDTPRNSAILGLGVTMHAAKSISFYADVSSELSSGQRVHALGVGMRYRW